MFDFSKIDLADKLIGFIIAIVQAMLIYFLTKHLLDKTFSRTRAIGLNLNKEGIVKVTNCGKMSRSEADRLFGRNGIIPVELKLCFLTGKEFFYTYQERNNYITKLAEKGCKIQILLCNPHIGELNNLWKGTDFSESNPSSVPPSVAAYYYDHFTQNMSFQSFLERLFSMTKHQYFSNVHSVEECSRIIHERCDYYYEIMHALYLLNNEKFVSEEAKRNIEIRFYDDEFRLSFLIARYPESSKMKKSLFAHTTLNAPIRVATESISISLEKSENERAAYFDDLESTFSYLWDKYKSHEYISSKEEQL